MPESVDTMFVHRNQRLAARQIGDETVVVQADRSRLHLLTNDVASRIWQLADGRRTVRAICERLSDEYDAAPEAIARDVEGFLAELVRLDLVTLESWPAGG